MRMFWGIITAILIGLGFLFSILWIFAIITGAFALIAKPPGLRPDGKRRSGLWPIGALWDKFYISQVMKDCPFCKSKIDDDAQKCPHCGEWVPENVRHRT